MLLPCVETAPRLCSHAPCASCVGSRCVWAKPPSHAASYKSPRSPGTAQSSQVLLALEHMHEKNFVHRDLKLENLLITHDGAIKLTDFGFAKKARAALARALLPPLHACSATSP